MKQKVPKPKKFQQNTSVKKHYHPRWLARKIVHSKLAHEDATGVNKVAQGAKQSPFAQHWRDEAEAFAK